MKKENKSFKECKELINLYLKNQEISYGKEIKIAKKLLSLYPLEFWEQYHPEIEIYSLTIFLMPAAKREIDKNYNMFLLTKEKEEIKLENEPVIQLDYEREKFRKQPRNLAEFINDRY